MRISLRGFLRPLFRVFSGVTSALTGTGVCEFMQSELAANRQRPLVSTNATAIALEATANAIILLSHLFFARVQFSIFLWSGLGTLIGAQIRAALAPPASHCSNAKNVWLEPSYHFRVLCVSRCEYQLNIN